MSNLKFRINSKTRTFILTNIKMNQQHFSYNYLSFDKLNNNEVLVTHQQQIVEETQENKDLGLSWAISDTYHVLYEYSKKGHNPYNPEYVMFEFQF